MAPEDQLDGEGLKAIRDAAAILDDLVIAFTDELNEAGGQPCQEDDDDDDWWEFRGRW